MVRSGDYLTGIAAKLGVKLADLLALNTIKITSLIYPGLRLKLPVGGTLPVVAAPIVAAPIVAGEMNARIAKVLSFAKAQLGEPYRFNSAGPDSWDCSGLTLAAYAEIGISLPHYSGAQVTFGTAIDWKNETVKPGDLIFLETAVGTSIIGHVGLALNATQWLQSPRTGDVVRIGNIPSTRIVAVRRLVQGG